MCVSMSKSMIECETVSESVGVHEGACEHLQDNYVCGCRPIHLPFPQISQKRSTIQNNNKGVEYKRYERNAFSFLPVKQSIREAIEHLLAR